MSKDGDRGEGVPDGDAKQDEHVEAAAAATAADGQRNRSGSVDSRLGELEHKKHIESDGNRIVGAAAFASQGDCSDSEGAAASAMTAAPLKAPEFKTDEIEKLAEQLNQMVVAEKNSIETFADEKERRAINDCKGLDDISDIQRKKDEFISNLNRKSLDENKQEVTNFGTLVDTELRKLDADIQILTSAIQELEVVKQKKENAGNYNQELFSDQIARLNQKIESLESTKNNKVKKRKELNGLNLKLVAQDAYNRHENKINKGFKSFKENATKKLRDISDSVVKEIGGAFYEISKNKFYSSKELLSKDYRNMMVALDTLEQKIEELDSLKYDIENYKRLMGASNREVKEISEKVNQRMEALKEVQEEAEKRNLELHHINELLDASQHDIAKLDSEDLVKKINKYNTEDKRVSDIKQGYHENETIDIDIDSLPSTLEYVKHAQHEFYQKCLDANQSKLTAHINELKESRRKALTEAIVPHANELGRIQSELDKVLLTDVSGDSIDKITNLSTHADALTKVVEGLGVSIVNWSQKNNELAGNSECIKQVFTELLTEEGVADLLRTQDSITAQANRADKAINGVMTDYKVSISEEIDEIASELEELGKLPVEQFSLGDVTIFKVKLDKLLNNLDMIRERINTDLSRLNGNEQLVESRKDKFRLLAGRLAKKIISVERDVEPQFERANEREVELKAQEVAKDRQKRIKKLSCNTEVVKRMKVVGEHLYRHYESQGSEHKGQETDSEDIWIKGFQRHFSTDGSVENSELVEIAVDGKQTQFNFKDEIKLVVEVDVENKSIHVDHNGKVPEGKEEVFLQRQAKIVDASLMSGCHDTDPENIKIYRQNRIVNIEQFPEWLVEKIKADTIGAASAAVASGADSVDGDVCLEEAQIKNVVDAARKKIKAAFEGLGYDADNIHCDVAVKELTGRLTEESKKIIEQRAASASGSASGSASSVSAQSEEDAQSARPVAVNFGGAAAAAAEATATPALGRDRSGSVASSVKSNPVQMAAERTRKEHGGRNRSNSFTARTEREKRRKEADSVHRVEGSRDRTMSM